MTEQNFKNTYENAVKKRYPSAEFITTPYEGVGYTYLIYSEEKTGSDVRNGALIAVFCLFMYLIAGQGTFFGDLACIFFVISIGLTFLYILRKPRTVKRKLTVPELDKLVSDLSQQSEPLK